MPTNADSPPRGLFKDQAYEELRSRLFSNDYSPGTKLSERKLAAELGMSKTPIKAALERLEVEGYITISPQSGIVVREPTDEEIEELFELRAALEGFVLRSVAGRLTEEQIATLEQNLCALEDIATDPSRRVEVVVLDTQFHRLPSEFLGNQQILNLTQQFSDKIRLVTTSVFSLMPYRASQSLIEHREILEALRAGQGQQASDLMEAHIRLGHKLLWQARRESANVPQI